MSLKLILEDWSEYDNKKIADKRDSKDFACSERWERDYLASKILKIRPFINRDSVIAAINSCCITVPTPHPRKEFVKCVAIKLGLTID